MGGEIPHIIICNTNIDHAHDIIAAVLGDGGMYCVFPGIEQVYATTFSGLPYIFYLRDLID